MAYGCFICDGSVLLEVKAGPFDPNDAKETANWGHQKAQMKQKLPQRTYK